MRNFLSVVVFLSLLLWSCVDIPENGPQLPDPQTVTRYMHLATGVDTISLALRTESEATRDGQSDTIISGSDTIAWSDSFFVVTTISHFKRYQVDYSETMKLFVDGVSFGDLMFGDATSYREIPSGNRKIRLEMTGTHLDTVEYIKRDTNHVVIRDTVGKGKYKFDTSYSAKTFTFTPATQFDEVIIADSAYPSLLHASFEKATVFFMMRSAPLFNEIDERIRYGLIKYEFGWERRSFNPSPTDSIAIRFVNATQGASGKRLTIRGKSNADTLVTVTRMIDSLETNSLSPFLKMYNGVYSFYVSNGGSTTFADSVPNVVLSGGRRLTFTVTGNGSAIHIRKFDDD